MQTIERTITVPTPIQEVWDYVVDFTNTEQWDPPTESTVRVLGDGGVGTVYRNVSKVLGNEVESEYTVVQVQDQRLFQLEGANSGMQLRDTITFAGTESGTTLTYRAEFHPRGVLRFIEPLLPLGLKRLGDKTSDQLETCLRELVAS